MSTCSVTLNRAESALARIVSTIIDGEGFNVAEGQVPSLRVLALGSLTSFEGMSLRELCELNVKCRTQLRAETPAEYDRFCEGTISIKAERRLKRIALCHFQACAPTTFPNFDILSNSFALVRLDHSLFGIEEASHLNYLVDVLGCNPNTNKYRDETPLLHAVRLRKTRAVSALLALAQTDPNLPHKKNERTPLWQAAHDDQGEIVRILLADRRTDPYSTDSFGRSPLVIAAVKGNNAVVEAFKDREDIDLNRGDRYGRTPLLSAIDYCRIETVRLLLGTRQVNPTLAGYHGIIRLFRSTPQDLALMRRPLQIYKAIESRITADTLNLPKTAISRAISHVCWRPSEEEQ